MKTWDHSNLDGGFPGCLPSWTTGLGQLQPPWEGGKCSGGSGSEGPGTLHLVAQSGQVGGRLLSHCPDLRCRHQCKDILHRGGRVCPELVPKGVISGFHGLWGDTVSRAARSLASRSTVCPPFSQGSPRKGSPLLHPCWCQEPSHMGDILQPP